MKRGITAGLSALAMVMAMVLTGPPVSETKAQTTATPVTVGLDISTPVGQVPVDFLGTGKYNTDPNLQTLAKLAGFRTIRIDCLLDAVEPMNDNDDPMIMDPSGFQWGSGAAQYGADLEEVVTQMVENGHKPMIILHRTQPWNGNPDGDWGSVPKDIGEWAEAAAATVHHFNKELGLGIVHWEIWNEPNGDYEWLGTMDQYLEMAKAAALRMKAVDPGIKVGGPALAWADADAMRKVIQNGNGFLDFYSWHAYGTGGDDSAKVTDAALLAETSHKYGDFAKQLRKLITRYDTSGRPKEVVIDEFNIDWAQTPKGKERREGPVNAVWSASVLRHLLYAGVDMTNIFSLTECGIINADGNPTPVYHLYTFLSANLKGRLFDAASSSKSVEAMATMNGDKATVWLINKSSQPVSVTLDGGGLESRGTARVWRLADGEPAKRVSARVFGPGTKPLDLPGYSVTAIIY